MDETENRIVTLHDNVEEMKSTSKHYENFKKTQAWNNQDIWDTMKRPKLHIIGIEGKEESQDNAMDQIFNRIIEENFPKLKKDITIQIQEAHRTSNREDLKRNFPHHIIIKTVDAQNKERI